MYRITVKTNDAEYRYVYGGDIEKFSMRIYDEFGACGLSVIKL